MRGGGGDPGRRPRRRRLPAVAAAVLLGACSSSSAASLPGRPQVVDLVMEEYRFEGLPPKLDRGRIVFEVRNLGEIDHDLSMVYLEPGIPALDQQLRSDRRLVVPTIARLFTRKPGGRGTFAVDLEPGRYGLICFVMDPDGKQHSRKGMSAEFRVG